MTCFTCNCQQWQTITQVGVVNLPISRKALPYKEKWRPAMCFANTAPEKGGQPAFSHTGWHRTTIQRSEVVEGRCSIHTENSDRWHTAPGDRQNQAARCTVLRLSSKRPWMQYRPLYSTTALLSNNTVTLQTYVSTVCSAHSFLKKFGPFKLRMCTRTTKRLRVTPFHSHSFTPKRPHGTAGQS